MSVEAEANNILGISLEFLGNELSDFFFGDISLAWMKNFQDLKKGYKKRIQDKIPFAFWRGDGSIRTF